MKTTALKRCPWAPENDPLYLSYHDEEWGVPVHDDQKLYEFLILETFQAGLSWKCVLYKRENFRKAFKQFDYKKVAKFTPADVERLMQDAGIVRNRAKILAAIENAKAFMKVQKEFGSFSKYMWSWVNHKPIVSRPKTMKDYPPYTDKALEWAKDLKARGFKFMGPTVVYAHMQAVGMCNDHTVDCFRFGSSK